MKKTFAEESMIERAVPERQRPEAGAFSAESARSDSGRPFIPPFIPSFVQRKASCACGGGCAACQSESTNSAALKVSQPNDAAEIAADHIADKVMGMPASPAEDGKTQSAPASSSPLQRKESGSAGGDMAAPPIVNDVISSSGSSLDKGTRQFMESRMGHDFSSVQVHTDGKAAESARSVNAQAYTAGDHIVFNQGQYAPGTEQGKKLLAHELAHVGQQKGNLGRAVIQRKITDAQLETEFQTWAADHKEKVNKGGVDYPHQLWSFIFEMVGDPQTAGPKAKPQKPAELKKWQEDFEKAELVADWLINLKKTAANDSVKTAAESRLSGILDLMQQADLLTPAMSRANDLNPDNKKRIFEAILNAPQSATVNDIERIVSFFCAAAKDASGCLVIQILTDSKKHPLKTMDIARSKAMIKLLIHAYPNAPELVDALAELLMFNPKLRNEISEALMKSELGGSPALLFKVLKHKLFIEPEYGASTLPVLQGTDSVEDYEKKRMKDDMPWVYTFKQKYYVDFLIDMASKQTPPVVIPRPKKMAFADLKTWLDTNTGKIAAAAAATYSTQEEIFEVYRNIADIFFYHVPHDRNVQPDMAGGIGHLKPGLPSKMRFEADCDVFATYAMRFLTGGGFTPIGYLGFYPKGVFAGRAPHVVALVRKGNKYSFINNKDIFDTGIADTKLPDDKKAEAIVKLMEGGLAEGYGEPKPTDLDIFYGDADATGKMSSAFFSSDPSLKRPDLEKAAAPAVP